MINQILSILLLVLPVVVEWIQKKRTPEQTASDYVKQQQEEKLKTYEAMLEDTGANLSALRTMQLATVSQLLRRVREVRKPPK